MKSINEIVEQGLKENAKELKNNLCNLEDIKQIIQENNDFSFNIEFFTDIDYSLKEEFLSICLTFLKEEQHLAIYIKMIELNFRLNSTDIYNVLCVNLIKYANNYFNNKETIFYNKYDNNICYTNVKEYIQNFLNLNDKEYVEVRDYKLQKNL